MPFTTALWILTWAAIVLLLFCLAAVLREVKILRSQVEAFGWQAVPVQPTDTVELPARVTGGRRRLVLAANTGCPMCQMLAHHLAENAGRFDERPVLLTYEGVDAWEHLPAGLDVVSDDVAWKAVAHLSPPVVMLVEADGSVAQLSMPTSLDELENNLAAWHLVPAVRTHEEL